MCAKKAKTTKKKIVSAAWKLFYEQGYDNTTVDDIMKTRRLRKLSKNLAHRKALFIIILRERTRC